MEEEKQVHRRRPHYKGNTLTSSIIYKRFRIFGIVQGVGFRPFVAGAARAEKIRGSVCNKGSYVEVFACGSRKALDRFEDTLRHRAPARSIILRLEVRQIKEEDFDNAGTFDETFEKDDSGFFISTSDHEKGSVFVSPDIAICPDCQRELFDPENRRYLHPFINCTACGPRLTILEHMPYDRERTSMKSFPMCPVCRKEYTDPADRRYDAQPVCCKDCGPELSLYDLRADRESGTDRGVLKRDAALVRSREILRAGGILAVKGIGGFHLCCDARNSEAVCRLRRLKNRPFKPFAVMAKDLRTAGRECIFSENEKEMMTGPRKPILLLPRKEGGKIAEEAAPGCPDIGLMLPYAPVQLLLFDYPDKKPMTDCLIMTSGNPSGAPICRTDDQALTFLSPMCDGILTNNRDILVRADDSVMMYLKDQPYMVRRSRGFAPLPVSFSAPRRETLSGRKDVLSRKTGSKRVVLGIGGELKNTFCLGNDEYLYLSPYIGDLADRRSVQALSAALTRLEDLLEMRPSMVVSDLHPRYNSGRFARSLGLPVLEMQHHYAHIVSCMAENDYHDPEHEDNVIGVSFDGTGYGTDGTVWGGEFLRCSYRDFERIGSLEPFVQAGGDLSSREGWRIALSLLEDAFSGPGQGGPDQAKLLARQLDLCTGQEYMAQDFLLKSGTNCVPSTSAGRLFDAAASLTGLKKKNTYEGEAATALEYAAARWLKSHDPESLSTSIDTGRFLRAASFLKDEEKGGEKLSALQKEAFTAGRKDDLVRFLVRQRLDAPGDTDRMDFCAAVFHEYLAQVILCGCRRMRQLSGLAVVALSGGCFQNRTLTLRAKDLLEKDGFTVLVHSLVPPNDGGIALGQAAYGITASAGPVIL